MARPTSREKLLDAAEALFAERGLAAVSLRAINAAVGLSPAALHYHFGTKQILVEAILLRRMPELMAKRGALLEELAVSADPPDARAVAGAFLRPLVELLLDEPEAGRRYIRFLARAFADGDVDTGFVLARFQEDVARLDPLLQRALPELPIDLVRVRLGIAIESGLHALANADTYSSQESSQESSYEQLSDGTQKLSPEQFANVLLDFIAGGLGAPCRLAQISIPNSHDFASPPPEDDARESKPGENA